MSMTGKFWSMAMVCLSATLSIACLAGAAVVTERWGVEGQVQHPATLSFSGEAAGTILAADLKGLPKDANVYRARLVLIRGGLYGSRFEILPAGADGAAAAGAKPLELEAPYYRSFDATDVVRSWAKTGARKLLLRQASKFNQAASYIEIAYEGELKDPPPQAKDIKARYQAGQVFIAFREIEDPAKGKSDATWAELKDAFPGFSAEGVTHNDRQREVRYRVYRHDQPITAANIGQARLVGEVAPGSAYNARMAPAGDFIGRRGQAVAKRLAFDPGKPLEPGMGLFVYTVPKDAKGYYAVVTAVNGVENTSQIDAANVVGPIDEKVAPPEPVLESVEELEATRGVKYLRQWYSLHCDQPLAPHPVRHDLAVGFCPDKLAKPARLLVTRGHSWESNPEPEGPGPSTHLSMTHSADVPNEFFTGTNDALGTLKGIEQGRWQPFTQLRQEAIIRWMQKTWAVDEQRIASSLGAYGMFEIERGDLYNYIYGWGSPEITKGFVSIQKANGAWGPPEAYAGREDNPYLRLDYSRLVAQNPQKELPYFMLTSGWGMHLTEMGWPPIPRFLRSMTDGKHAFVASWIQGSVWGWQSTPVHRAVWSGLIDLRRQQSLPALANCSLDDNPGDGLLASGDLTGQINGYILWDTATIRDEPKRWEMSFWLDKTAHADQCTVDLTPRRCQKFTAKPGQKFRWTNVLLANATPQELAEQAKAAAAAKPKATAPASAPSPASAPAVVKTIATGQAMADRNGLVTIENLQLSKSLQRVIIEAQ